MSLRAKVILIFSAVLILGAGAIAFFAYEARLSKGLDVQISGPEKVLIGVPFEAKINIANSSEAALQQVRLSVTLPDGLVFLGSPQTKNVDFRDLSSLGPGGVSQQVFKLIALNGQNTFKKITAGVTYLSGSLSSRFEKSADFELAVGDYGISLDIATPQKIFSGESFDAQLTYKNNSDIDFDNLKLTLSYPQTFNFVKSTLNPDIGNNIWTLGGLRHGSDNKFKITGSVIGPEGANFEIKSTIAATFLGQDYPITVNSASINIASSPLSIKISLNENPEYIAKAGDALGYTVSYVNNTDAGLRDVVIKAQLIGEMFDFGQLSTNGSFRSTDNTITWNASNAPELGTLSPGASGSVNFALKARSSYPIRRLSDKNFLLKVRATIESPTVPDFIQANKTFSLSSIETKVAGQLQIASKVFFRDAVSGVINNGPFPPRVNQATQYTVHWLLTNYSTDAKDITVSAFLSGNVKFAGFAKASSGTSAPVYNDRTQQMTWAIARVPATVGVISAPLEAVFQITATPSSSDLNTFMQLIQDTLVEGTDDFTTLKLTSASAPVTTQLPDDPTVAGMPGVVTK